MKYALVEVYDREVNLYVFNKKEDAYDRMVSCLATVIGKSTKEVLDEAQSNSGFVDSDNGWLGNMSANATKHHVNWDWKICQI